MTSRMLVLALLIVLTGCRSGDPDRFPAERETLDCFSRLGWKVGSGLDPAGDRYVVTPKRFGVTASGSFSFSYSTEVQGPPPPGMESGGGFYEAMRSDRQAWATWIGALHDPGAEAKTTLRKCFLVPVS